MKPRLLLTTVITLFAAATVSFAAGLILIRQPVLVTPTPSTRAHPAGVTSISHGIRMNIGKPRFAYPEGAYLYWPSGDFKNEMDRQVKPDDADKTKRFYWEVGKVPHAEGVMWQVTLVGYPPFTGSESDLAPYRLLASGVEKGVTGSFVVDFGDIVQQAGLDKPGTAKSRVPAQITGVTHEVNPAVAGGGQKGPTLLHMPPRTPLEIARFTTFYALGGYTHFSVRILPIVNVDRPLIVGQPSNVIRVYYGDMPPSSVHGLPAPPPVPQINIKVLRFDYRTYHTYCIAHANTANCNTFKGGNKDILDDIEDFVTDTWDWACHAYSDAKGALVNAVGSVVPVPRSVLEAALDGALMAAGIPPDIPNLGELMDGGADYLADQMVEQIGPPVASDFMRDQLKKGILAAAKHASNIANNGPGTPCVYQTDPPVCLITMQNVGTNVLTGIKISWDANFSPFRPAETYVATVKPGQTVVVPLVLYPAQLPEFYDGQLYSDSKWWDAFHSRHFAITLFAWTREIYKSPNRIWDTPFVDQK